MAKNEAHHITAGVWTLGWVSFLSDTASDMIFPLLPDFLTRTLHAGPAWSVRVRKSGRSG